MQKDSCSAIMAAAVVGAVAGAAVESEAEAKLEQLWFVLSLQQVPIEVELAVEGTHSMAATVATAGSNPELPAAAAEASLLTAYSYTTESPSLSVKD